MPSTAGGLGECGIERHEFVPDLARVLVDRREERGRLGQAEIGLVERDLRGVDRLGLSDAVLRDFPPVLGVRRFALPERRNSHAVRRGDDHPVGMALHTSAHDRKAELIAMSIARAKIEAGLAQPGDGQVLENVPEREDPQGLAREPGARVLRRLQVFVLQPALADVTQPASPEIVALGTFGLFRHEGGVDAGIDGVRETGRLLPMVEVETGVHQNGTSGSGRGALVCIASWNPSTAAVVSASAWASLRSANRVVHPISAMSSAMFFKAARKAACSRWSGSIMRPPRGRVTPACGNAGWRGALDRCCSWESSRCSPHLPAGVTDCRMARTEPYGNTILWRARFLPNLADRNNFRSSEADASI
jgi:hypothetical protein